MLIQLFTKKRDLFPKVKYSNLYKIRPVRKFPGSSNPSPDNRSDFGSHLSISSCTLDTDHHVRNRTLQSILHLEHT